MRLHPVSASRPQRSPQWRSVPIGRSLLPVLAMLVLAAATAFGAWLLLFAVDYGYRFLTQGG